MTHLAQALSLIAPQYNAAQHERAAERMAQDMQKNPQTPEFWEDAAPVGTDINGRELRAVRKKQDLIYVNGEWKENAVKTAHTLGPWHSESRTCEPSRGHVVQYVSASSAAGIVAECWKPAGGNLEELAANARLIASAPDLLAALEAALPTLQSHMERYPNDKDERRIYDAARAAIARARGKEVGK